MEIKLSEISDNERAALLDAVANVIYREGPKTVQALYSRLERINGICLYGQKILPLLKEDPRFVLKGDHNEIIAPQEKPSNNENDERRSITSILGLVLSFFKEPENYSLDDVSFLNSRLKESGFTENDVISEIFSTSLEALEQAIMRKK